MFEGGSKARQRRTANDISLSNLHPAAELDARRAVSHQKAINPRCTWDPGPRWSEWPGRARARATPAAPLGAHVDSRWQHGAGGPLPHRSHPDSRTTSPPPRLSPSRLGAHGLALSPASQSVSPWRRTHRCPHQTPQQLPGVVSTCQVASCVTLR